MNPILSVAQHVGAVDRQDRERWKNRFGQSDYRDEDAACKLLSDPDCDVEQSRREACGDDV